MKRFAEKVFQKDLETEVYKNLESQPDYHTQYVLNLCRYQNRAFYESAIQIGNKEFYSDTVPLYLERAAQKQAMLNAYKELSESNWKFDPEDCKETGQSICMSNMDIYDCGKYMSNDTLATLFRDMVRHLSYRKSYKLDRYTTCVCNEGGLTGYTAELFFNGETFQSAGLMVDENQAQQSAAEVCLRTLGFLPPVNSDNLIIQPYRGGLPMKVDGVTNEKPYIFTSTLSSDILQAFVFSQSMLKKPKYYVKDVSAECGKESTVESEKLVHCVCCVDGKLFKATDPHNTSIAMQLAADEAIKYFGIHYPHGRMELRKHLRIYKYDFYTEAYLPTDRQPSKTPSWTWKRFARQNYAEYDDIKSMVKAVEKSGAFISNLPSWEYQQELIKTEISRFPSFKGDLLSELLDVCVCDIDKINPSLVTIGNSNFSIKMLCSEGKIYSTKRNGNVEILPGHNLQKLKCEYRIALPSLEVYLKAVKCEDLYYPNPAQPVVTSCGLVVLVHDYNASPTDVHVLLQRKKCNKRQVQIHLLQALLQKLIDPLVPFEVTPADCMEDIEKWEEGELKLLVEMSMESLCLLMSNYIQYDTRWNELFARTELPDELNEIQVICTKELDRRNEEGSSVEEESDTTPWELPQSEFISYFETIGIYLEDSNVCAVRSLAESTGMKMQLGDIEKCPVVDIPVVNEMTKHRGDVTRYYIWKKIEEGTPTVDEGLTELLNEGYSLYDKRIIEHGRTRYIYFVDEAKRNKYLSNVHYLEQDGSKIPSFVESLKKYEDTVQVKDNVAQDPKSSLTEETHPDETTNPENDDLLTICLPGNPGFVTYKNSLKQYCALQHLDTPKFQRNKLPKGTGLSRTLRCTVMFGSFSFSAEGRNTKTVEEGACKTALVGLGYVVPADEEVDKETIEDVEDDEAGKEKNEVAGDAMEDQEVAEEVDPYSITTADVEGSNVDAEKGVKETDIKIEVGSVESIRSRRGRKRLPRHRKKHWKKKRMDYNGESSLDYQFGPDGQIKKEVEGDEGVPVGETGEKQANEGEEKEEQKGEGEHGMKDRRVKYEISYPSRCAVREECVWVTLDKALELCPTLQTISSTVQFQQHLKTLVDEANEFLKSQNIDGVVQTSLL